MGERLTRGQRRRLQRYECAWCDQRLDRDSCSAIGEKCSPELRQKRRDECLAEYKPRALPREAP